MFAFLTGLVAGTAPDYAIIDVNGVGYKVNMSAGAIEKLPKLNDPVCVHTSVQVREDSMQIYGFNDEAERDAFELLLTVSGIGPKNALQITGLIPTGKLMSALVTENIDLLVSVPGIGKKTAQRMLLELKEKVKTHGHHPIGANQNEVYYEPDAHEAVQALISLGYQPAAARHAIEEAKNVNPDAGIEILIREGLTKLGKIRG